MADQNSL